jgi:heat shock 70kDa protein 1/2/6/8
MGNKTTPSYVAFTDTERLIGDAAKNQAAMNPRNTIYDVKRLIGRKFSDPIVQRDIKLWPFEVVPDHNDKPMVKVILNGETKLFSAEEISAMVLTKMKETAESALGHKVTKAVITCPAYFNDAQRSATKDAAIIAGLEPIRILNEPTAAALAYGLEKKGDKNEKNVLIYDLGGGTFDVSVLNIADGMFEVKATGGDTHLGGEDFDNDLLQYCMEDFKRRCKKDLKGNQRAVKRLKIACERAKRALSTSVQTTIEVDSLFEGIDYNTTLTRARFEETCGHWFRESINHVERVLRDSKLAKSQIDEVVLVGGSTRIPMVQRLLSEYFNGKELCKSVNPDEAVAFGAAVQAAILSGDKHEAINSMVLVDVCPLSLGVETSGQMMTVLIPRNTSIPTKKSDMFSTYADNQTSVAIKIYEGERQFTRDNNLLGTFELSGIPPMPRGRPRIEISYDVDTNGILTVTACETSNNIKKSIVIKNDKGRLSKEEIERLVEESKLYEAKDKEKRECIQARQDVEAYLYNMRNSVRESKSEDKVSIEKVETIVKDGLEWLENHPSENMDSYKKKQQELEQLLYPILTMLQSGSKDNMSNDDKQYSGSTNPFTDNHAATNQSHKPKGPQIEQLD